MIEGYEKYKDSPLGNTCQTEKGNKYKMFSAGGLVEEGEEYGHWSTSKDDIWHLFWNVFFIEQMLNKGKEIKWRRFPEWSEREVINCEGYFGDEKCNKITLYQITARFVWE